MRRVQVRKSAALLVFAVALLLPTLAAQASLALVIEAPSIDVGHWYFNEGEGVVDIPIYMTGDIAITDVIIRAQIGDDAPTPEGAPNMPVFVGAEFAGTFFGLLPGGYASSVNHYPQFLQADLSALELEDVLSNGLLLTLKVDVSGLTAGQSFSLLLANGDEDSTWLHRESTGEEYINVINGSINIVPEPASLALISAGLLLILRRR